MATLEDKILGEKLENYCSSSESESDFEEDASNQIGSGKGGGSSKLQFISEDNIKEQSHWSGSAANTGPKGVIRDWQRYKQLETEQRNHQDQEKLELIKKLSITARTNREDDEAKKQQQLDDELEELMSDDFLLEYQKKRIAEMLEITGNLPSFGTLAELNSGEEFLKMVDSEQKTITVIIHLYNQKLLTCNKMNVALSELATDYTHVRFCKMLSCVAGLSKTFNSNGVPALLVYKAGNMIGNFVRITDDLSDEFNSSDVESFLIELGMLPDKSCVPVIMNNKISN